MGPEALEHFKRGATLSQERQFESAAREFDASYKAEPSKEALFAWAQVERLRGQCKIAIGLYQRLLVDAPTPTQLDVATLNIRRCERIIEEENRPLPGPTTGRGPAAAGGVGIGTATEPAADTRRPSRLGIVLAGGAAAALATSAVFFALSRADENAAGNAEGWSGYYGAAQRARQRQGIAAAAGGTSLLLAGAAAIFWWQRPVATSAPVAWIGNDGAGLAWRGHY